MATRDKKPSAFAKTSNVLTTVNPHIDNLAQSFTIGDTKVLGTNGVNNVRFAFNRTAVNRDNDPYFDPHDLGSNVNSYVPHQMIVVVTGGFNIAAATATRGIAAEQLIAGERRPRAGARQAPARLRRQRCALHSRSEDVGAGRRPMELHRAGVRARTCRLPSR